MLSALLRVQLASFKMVLLGNSRKKAQTAQQQKSRIVLFALLMVYVFGVFGFLFFGYFSMISKPYYNDGVGWLYFAMFSVADFALMFIGSVFTAKGQLFEAKDNELMLSLPIKPSYILLSRMMTLLIINYLFNLVVAIPAAMAWGMSCPVTVKGAVAFAAIVLLLPFFSVTISALFAWLISLLTRRMRNKTILSTVLSLIFMAAYFVVISQAQSFMGTIATQGEQLSQKFSAFVPLLWIGKSIGEGNLLYLLFSVLFFVIPFGIAYAILSATLIKTLSTKHGFAKVKYVEKELEQKSVGSALLSQQAGRFFSSSAYILNGGLGALLLLVGGIALFFLKGTLLEVFSQITTNTDLLLVLLLAAACMIISMMLITAASVSIEGNTIWIMQSLPVSAKAVLKSKLAFHMIVVSPAAVIAVAGIAYVTGCSILGILCCALVTLIFALMTALMGLMANLRHPFLDWTNETQAVKSGIAVLIAMMLSWLATALVGAALYFLSLLLPLWAVMLIVSAIMLCVCYLIYGWIMKKGAVIYSRL